MRIKDVQHVWPLFLLPVFFLLNAANEYPGDLDVRFFLRMGGYLLLLILLVSVINALLFKNHEQVLAFSFLALIYIVFTRNMYTGLSEYISKSLFFLLSAILLAALFILIRKSDAMALRKFNRSLVFVFFVLIVYETGSLVYHAAVSKKQLSLDFPDQPQLDPWKTDSKPNIYLLLFDEYQGNEGLKQLFGYENNAFQNHLRQNGFRIIKQPKSNYNYTYFSVPSMFAMSYLRYSDGRYDLKFNRVIKSINSLDQSNPFTQYLVNNGYAIRNNSIFDIADIPTPYSFDGLDEDVFAVLYSRTLPGWVRTDLLHVAPSNSIHKAARDLYYQFFTYNRSVLHDTEEAIHQAKGGPVFVYSHFLLPHLPVVTDSSGKLRDIGEAADELHANKPVLKSSYLHYTRYADKICKEIVNDILKHDQQAVIIMVSDHGLRRVLGSNWVHDIQMAVKMPGSVDHDFYDGMSLVNLLRTVLNGISGQRMKMLPDSTISVK